MEVNTDTTITILSHMEIIQIKQIINQVHKVMETNIHNKICTIPGNKILNPLTNLQTLPTKTFLMINSIWLSKNKSTKSKAVVANDPTSLKTHQTHCIMIILMKLNLAWKSISQETMIFLETNTIIGIFFFNFRKQDGHQANQKNLPK